MCSGMIEFGQIVRFQQKRTFLDFLKLYPRKLHFFSMFCFNASQRIFGTSKYLLICNKKVMIWWIGVSWFLKELREVLIQPARGPKLSATFLDLDYLLPSSLLNMFCNTYYCILCLLLENLLNGMLTFTRAEIDSTLYLIKIGTYWHHWL